jgi:hypothetical protein
MAQLCHELYACIVRTDHEAVRGKLSISEALRGLA